MNQKIVLDAVLLALVAALSVGLAIATALYGIDWANGLQQRLFGWYGLKISFAILLLPVSILAVPLFLLGQSRWARLRAALRARAAEAGLPALPAGDPGAPPAKARVFLWLSLASLLFVWGGGGGYSLWHQRTLQADREAAYLALDLRAGGPLPAPLPGHLSLRCIPLTEATVTEARRNGTGDATRYIPLVGVGWTKSELVRLVLRLGPAEGLQQPGAAPAAEGRDRHPRETTLRVRVDGRIPAPALVVLRQEPIRLADEALLVSLVQGSPGARLAADDWFDPQTLAGNGLTLSAILLLAIGLLLAVVRLGPAPARPAPGLPLQQGALLEGRTRWTGSFLRLAIGGACLCWVGARLGVPGGAALFVGNPAPFAVVAVVGGALVALEAWRRAAPVAVRLESNGLLRLTRRGREVGIFGAGEVRTEQPEGRSRQALGGGTIAALLAFAGAVLASTGGGDRTAGIWLIGAGATLVGVLLHDHLRLRSIDLGGNGVTLAREEWERLRDTPLATRARARPRAVAP